MVVCKFFLQGTCKFGDYCKFEHKLDNYNTYQQNQSNTSILRQSTFGGPQSNAFSTTKPTSNVPTSNTNTDLNNIVKLVLNDMLLAEKGGQWRLSCYGPLVDKPLFPGFADRSFEEIREAFYLARSNGTLDQFTQNWASLVQEAERQMKGFQNPSMELVTLIKSLYCTPTGSNASAFGGNTTNAFIGGQQASVFGQTPASSSIFGAANQSLFGANTAPTSGSSIFSRPTNTFATPASNSPFAQQQQQNAFGAAAAPTQSIFAVQQNQASNSIFGAQTPSGQSIFTAKPATFQSTGNSIFGGVQSGNSPFLQQQQSAFSGGTTSTNSPFGGTVTTSSPFGGNLATNVGGFSGGGNTFVGSNAQIPQENPQFGIANTPFAVAPQLPQGNSPFGVSANPISQPFTQNVPNSNIFGAVPVNNSQSTPSNVFGEQLKPTSIFSSVQAISQSSNVNVNSQMHSSSIFGAGQPQQQSIFGGGLPPQQTSSNVFGANSTPSAVDLSLYSKLEDLSQEEVAWFESDDLDIFKIPENPPTFQMCFKV